MSASLAGWYMKEGHFPWGSVYRLYHGTTAESALKILNEGFKTGPEQAIWLTRDFNRAEQFAWSAIIEIEITGRVLEELGARISGDDLIITNWCDYPDCAILKIWYKGPMNEFGVITGNKWKQIGRYNVH